MWPGSQREGIHPSRKPLEEHTPQGQLVEGLHRGKIREWSGQKKGLGGEQVSPLPAFKTVLGQNSPSSGHLHMLELEAPLGLRQGVELGPPIHVLKP